jgi:predicted Zn-dependent protease
MQFIGWFKGGKLEHIPLAAEDFLTIMSELAVGWLLLAQASIALEKLAETSETHPDHAFYMGKKYAALYFANSALTTLPSRVQRLSEIDALPVEIPDEAFATV